MGRYYMGDIEGKFWFGLQSSDAADRFGVTGEEPNYITYYFDEDNLDDVEKEIKNIEESLGDKLQTIENFFKDNNGYNDDMLEKAGITKNELSDYADLGLGKQIKDCIEKTGQCSFDAEL